MRVKKAKGAFVIPKLIYSSCPDTTRVTKYNDLKGKKKKKRKERKRKGGGKREKGKGKRWRGRLQKFQGVGKVFRGQYLGFGVRWAWAFLFLTRLLFSDLYF